METTTLNMLHIQEDDKTVLFVPESTTEEYRLDPGINQSGLSLYADSPRGYFGVMEGEMEGFTSSGFRQGDALDVMILTPDKFENEYFEQPFEMNSPSTDQEKAFCDSVRSGHSGYESIVYAGYKVEKKSQTAIEAMAEERLVKFEEWFEYVKELEQGLTPYTQKQYQELIAMQSAINAHKRARRILNDPWPKGFIGYSQAAIFWNHLGYRCKGLLDRVLINDIKKVIIFGDLKYTSFSVGYFRSAVKRYRYYRQLSFYRDGLQKIFPDYKIIAYLIPVTPKWGGEVRTLRMEDAWFELGRFEYESLMRSLIWAHQNDKFTYRREYYESNGEEILYFEEDGHLITEDASGEEN